ncbi:hypothetical protein [Argonema galeatum]|uniref:hypothetical protein n=1 Tax=Argonema galeatum TaxID=2942762 RepID=UPI002011B31C|nr:hypothetical protein [Argonema galeatum]MCL1466996.1 hypothetical protein [Argonema galeatum A003/A1]
MPKTIDTPNFVKLEIEKLQVSSPNIDKVMEKFICTEILAKDQKNTDTGTSGDDRKVDD